MFHVPFDAIPDKSFSLNLIQLDHPNVILPSPEISPSSSPASLSCSSISSLKAWRSTSEQFQSPTFSFPLPIYRDAAAVATNSSHEHSGQHISCVPMSALDLDIPSSTIPSVEEDELGDLHWTTGVPCHMMDVFRADPFAAMDLPPPTSTIHPSPDNPTNPNSSQYKIGGLYHTRSATKHVLSPDAVEQKRKTRRKRARIHSPPVVPFPSTGPQKMFAYEFRLEIPYKSIRVSPHVDYQRLGDLDASYSSARTMDDREHIHIPRPVMAYGSEDASMRSPLELEQDMELFLPPRLPYSCSLTALIPPKIRPEHHIQLSHYPLPPVPFSTHVSSRLQDPSSSATSISRQGIDEYRPQFDEHGCCSLPHAVPMQDRQERASSDYRLSALSTTSLVQKPLYACPLCPRDFQLPNGLALHLKWHDRVGNITQNPTRCLSRRVAPRQTNAGSGPLDTRDVRLVQIPAQEDGQEGTISGLPSIPYVASQEAKLAQAESVSKSLECGLMFVALADILFEFEITSSSHEQYTTNTLSFERQPQECALFHDALQINHNVDSNTYLAPLDDLSVLQPLPFEQTTGHLCAISPP
ncbi:hypothetical protein F5888DRAFT_790972 [Russula emetica]|nr:hypothetical protein F5888DRAFT_790972 [Russula emetica]